jgi:MazG family protein
MAQADQIPPIERLLQIMARLRDRERGCPWDVEQSFATIAPYTIEEAYEVADAITRADMPALKEELGDLLFQVVFHARMAEEAGHFDFRDVTAALADKMIRRHPHVFDVVEARTADEQTAAWEDQKAQERGANGAGTLDGVPLNLPALLRAQKLQKRAGRVGFDWGSAGPALDKLAEEVGELRAELTVSRSPERVAEEVGDLLFAAVNVARLAGVDAETVLRAANGKFQRRFAAIEAALRARGKTPESSTLEEMDALWNDIKAAERSTV